MTICQNMFGLFGSIGNDNRFAVALSELHTQKSTVNARFLLKDLIERLKTANVMVNLQPF